jgi:hypothetical protein
MSGKKANNHPGLCPIKGQQPGLSGNMMAQDQLSSLSPSASKSLPQCHVLFIQPALNFLLYILPRDSQGLLWSNKMVNETLPCELIGNFISTKTAIQYTCVSLTLTNKSDSPSDSTCTSPVTIKKLCPA